MNYEPTNWKSGDVVTSAKLNKMEQGIATNNGWVIEVNIQTVNNNDILILGNGTITYEMLENALEAGKMIYFKISESGDTDGGGTYQSYTYLLPFMFELSFTAQSDNIIGYFVKITLFGDDQIFGAETKTAPLVYNWYPFTNDPIQLEQEM